MSPSPASPPVTVAVPVELAKQPMKTIEWHCENGMNGCDLKGSFEIEDDATDAEIDSAAREEIFNYVSWSWWVASPTPAERGVKEP